nr:calponin homology domain-containing protein DDB_G0272472-like [Onthophagus taurus]
MDKKDKKSTTSHEEGNADPSEKEKHEQQPRPDSEEQDNIDLNLIELTSEKESNSARFPPQRERARSLDTQRAESETIEQEEEESREGKRKQRDSLERDLKRSKEENQTEGGNSSRTERRLSLEHELTAAERLKSGGKRKTTKGIIEEIAKKIDAMVGLIQQNTAVPLKNSIREMQGRIRVLRKVFEKEERERKAKMESLHKQIDKIQSDIELRVEEGKKMAERNKVTLYTLEKNIEKYEECETIKEMNEIKEWTMKATKTL